MNVNGSQVHDKEQHMLHLPFTFSLSPFYVILPSLSFLNYSLLHAFQIDFHYVLPYSISFRGAKFSRRLLAWYCRNYLQVKFSRMLLDHEKLES